MFFSPLKIGNITIQNRLIRSATYEGMADENGNPLNDLGHLYDKLAKSGLGAIITGFCYVSKQGRAMHYYQTGIDSDDKVEKWKNIINKAKSNNPEVKIFMQLAHTGRQTLQKITKQEVVGASDIKCSYFKENVRALKEKEIEKIVDDFGLAAQRAKLAGFDGVQVHAAHGYLIHQFISSYTNNRKDKYSDKSLLLIGVLKKIKQTCGKDFPILLKISHSDDRGLTNEDAINIISKIENLADAVEISYGTMEYALNIIRGDCPLDDILVINQLFNKIPTLFKSIWKRIFSKRFTSKFIPFTKNYNLKAATEIKKHTKLPIINVGGVRDINDMKEVLCHVDAISMCRPFIIEPNLVEKIKTNNFTKSKCINCNKCAIYCDSENHLQCYKGQS